MVGTSKDGCSGLCACEYGGTIAGEDVGIGVDVGVEVVGGALTQPEIINDVTIATTRYTIFPLIINQYPYPPDAVAVGVGVTFTVTFAGAVMVIICSSPQ